MINCPICLDILSSEAFGCTAPCGHYFHSSCWANWVASSSKPLANGCQYTKCPSCNVVATDFIKSYLDLDRLAVDDVSISDDSISDHEEIADECSDCGSIHGAPGDADVDLDADADADTGDNLDDGASAGSDQEFNQWLEDIGGRATQPRSDNPSRPRSQLSSTTSSNNDIIILDSDEDENHNDNEVIVQSVSPASKSSRLQFRKVSSTGSSNLNGNGNDTRKSPRPNAISNPKQRTKETKHAQSSSTKDRDKLEKKYKLLKRKLAAMKASMKEQQEKNKVHLEVKSEYDKLKQEMKNLSENFEKEVYDSRHDKRELRELRAKADSMRKERDLLRENRIKENAIHNREKERMKDLTENAKATGMQEMKLIISQNGDLRKENHEIIEEWKSMSSQKKQTDKINARLKRKLDELSEEELVQNIEASKKVKPQSRTKTVELFRHGMKEAEDARILDEEEWRHQERKDMIRKSSSQLARVVAAANKQHKRKVRPSFLENASVKKDASRSLPFSSVPSTFRPKPSIGAKKVIRKKPAGGDLRRMFKKI